MSEGPNFNGSGGKHAETALPLKETPALGVKGVELKLFEQVLVSLLQDTVNTDQTDDPSKSVAPHFVRLPTPTPVPPPWTATPSTNSPTSISVSDSERTKDLFQKLPHDDSGFFGSRLPRSARVQGSLPGQIANASRAQRKQEQLDSMMRCIFSLLPLKGPASNSRPFTIVDFGGGSGHLGIPLALLLPRCRVIVVDLTVKSIELLHSKAIRCVQERNHHPGESTAPANQTLQKEVIAPTAIPNLFTFWGPLERFPQDERFDIGVALHLCGQSTDMALRLCGQAHAVGVVACPCCVGKLNSTRKNPYIWHATGNNTSTVQYPQSKQFCKLLNKSSFASDPDRAWNALAKAADYSGENAGESCRTSRNATRRAAKALLETDRRLFLQETFDYRTALMRMEPWEASPKNDILVAWREDIIGHAPIGVDLNDTDDDCMADIHRTYDHLFAAPSRLASNDVSRDQTNKGSCQQPHGSSLTLTGNDGVDWTLEEELEIRGKLQEVFCVEGVDSHVEPSTYVFPTRMGGRKRKLIHFVAERLNLAHWSVGKKDRDKTVAVARRKLTYERFGQVTDG